MQSSFGYGHVGPQGADVDWRRLNQQWEIDDVVMDVPYHGPLDFASPNMRSERGDHAFEAPPPVIAEDETVSHFIDARTFDQRGEEIVVRRFAGDIDKVLSNEEQLPDLDVHDKKCVIVPSLLHTFERDMERPQAYGWKFLPMGFRIFVPLKTWSTFLIFSQCSIILSIAIVALWGYLSIRNMAGLWSGATTPCVGWRSNSDHRCSSRQLQTASQKRRRRRKRKGNKIEKPDMVVNSSKRNYNTRQRGEIIDSEEEVGRSREIVFRSNNRVDPDIAQIARGDGCRRLLSSCDKKTFWNGAKNDHDTMSKSSVVLHELTVETSLENESSSNSSIVTGSASKHVYESDRKSMVEVNSINARSFLSQVESVASVVSSSGLDRQSSLRLANESVLRRLETQFSVLCVSEAEMKKRLIGEKERAADRESAERRHCQLLRAMSVGRNEEEINKALNKLRKTAYNIFPGFLWPICVAFALIARSFCQTKRAGFVLLSFRNEVGAKEIIYKICGCAEAAKGDDWRRMPFISANLSERMSSLFLWTILPSLDTIWKFQCLANCSLVAGLLIFGLYCSHRLLEYCHCPEIIHHGANIAFAARVLLPAFLDPSFNLNPSLRRACLYSTATNACIMVATNVYMHFGWYTSPCAGNEHSLVVRRLQWIRLCGVAMCLICATTFGAIDAIYCASRTV